jgi:endoglucanase
MLNRGLGVALAAAVGVAAHGHVANVVIDGVYYQGYGADSFPYMANPPTVIGWTANDPDNGFVAPDAFGGPDIICHKSATPGGGHAQVKAGDSISLQWNTWPDSHHGPVIDYLANCNGPCESVDKTTLEFFKIDDPAYISGSNPGFWATDVLIQNNFTWLVQIPTSIAPGNYVLRHEIIALHAAGSLDGAQAYPQCINIQVVGSGSYAPAGVPGTALYKETDPGILYNVYTSPEAYTVPGPTLISGVPVSVSQFSSKATATSSATLPNGNTGGGGGTTTSPNTSKPTTTTKPTTSTSTLVITTKPQTTTTAPGSGTGQTLYGQCGGSGYTGATSCAQGHCSTINPYYYQCVN